MNAAEVARAAITALFVHRDPSAVDDYFGPEYRQHSALAPDGIEGLRGLVAGLPDGFGYELVRVFGEGDLAVTHGVYSGFGPAPVVGFDVWRIADGRIVEHWDTLAPGADTGGPMVAAAVDPSDSRVTVERWLSAPEPVDQERGHTATSRGARHQVIADGDFVYVRSEGDAVVINDLFRVDSGRVVEHWDLIAPVPRSLPHDNGVF